MRVGVGQAHGQSTWAVPAAVSAATGSWWTSVNEGVVAARAAEGHVTGDEAEEYDASARHQVEKRGTMRIQAIHSVGGNRRP